MKNYLKCHCCLDCQAFCWWDGDYCCTMQMKIHDHSKDGRMSMNIQRTMKTPETCNDYMYDDSVYSVGCFERDEYARFYELQNQIDLLNSFVDDKWNIVRK